MVLSVEMNNKIILHYLVFFEEMVDGRLSFCSIYRMDVIFKGLEFKAFGKGWATLGYAA